MARKNVEKAGRALVISPEVILAASGQAPLSTTTNGNREWMGPGVAPKIMVNPEIEARRLDYAVNINTRFIPKANEGVGFAHLRLLADAYDLLRIIIERRKDQVEAFEWSIVERPQRKKPTPVRPQPKEDPEAFKLRKAEAILEAAAPKVSDDDLDTITRFFEHPSTEYAWGEWIRAMLEDLLVIDAVTIAPRMTNGGELYSLDLVDGATIKRVIDSRGMTPMPPDPAYQQVLKGVPAVDFTVEEMFYWMRNPRTWRLYGFSPVEWVVVTVNTALNRQAFTMSYFTEGNIPEALATVPENWSTAQVKEFQDYWDVLMTGNMASRRRIKWIPTDASKIKELKQPDHKGEFDDWLARLMCFAFSISPGALVKEMNRATADTQREVAVEDGVMPILNFLKKKLNYIIQNVMGYPDAQFEWKLGESIDAKTQADINAIYLDKKVITPDEVREDLGKVALTPDEREMAFPTPPPPMMMPGSGEGATNPKQKEDAEEKVEVVAEKIAARVVSKLQPPDVNVTYHAPPVHVSSGDISIHADMRPQDDGSGVVSKTVTASREVPGEVEGKIVRRKLAQEA